MMSLRLEDPVLYCRMMRFPRTFRLEWESLAGTLSRISARDD